MTNVTMMVHNRPVLTKQALDGLVGTDTSVMILDDNSDEETQAVLKPWYGTSGLMTCDKSVLRIDKSCGTGANRNLVISQSEKQFGRGGYLYLSDNDVFFHPNWLPTLIDCYEAAWSSGCRVVGGVGHPYHQQGETLGVCSFNVRYDVKEVMAQPLQSMLMRWDVWDRFGPFDETEPGKVCQGEDVLFTKRIQEAGYKVGVVDPALIVNTGIANSFGELIPGWELVKAQCPEGIFCE